MIKYLLTTILIIIALISLALHWWISSPKSIEIAIRKEINDNQIIKQSPSTNIEGTLQKGTGKPSNHQGSWSQFRNANSTNICQDNVSITSHFPKDGPTILWQKSYGEGHAGAVIRNGAVYILDYDEEKSADTMRCLSLATGDEIWSRSYKIKTKRNHGISRTTPAVNDKIVVSIGPKCHVLCCEPRTGNFLWSIDLTKEYNTKVPLWYTGQCPIIDNEQVVIAPAGSSLLIGINSQTGKVIWRTPNPHNWKMSHSSIICTTIAGKRQYIYAALGGVAGISAELEDKGKLLWSTNLWNHAVVAPSPVPLPGNKIFLTAGYGAGSIILQIIHKDNKFQVEKVLDIDKKIFACEQQTPIFYNNYLYAILPKDAGTHRQEMTCMTPKGKVIWNSGKKHRFGLGPFIIADKKLIILSDDGTLTIANVNNKQYKPLTIHKIINGTDAWAPLATANGLLILRDSRNMLCIDIKSKKVKQNQ